MGEKGGKKRELDFKVTGYFWLDSLFSRNKQRFLVCRSPEGAAGGVQRARRSLLRGMMQVPAPCVSANICRAEVCLNLHQLHRLGSVANAALCHPHHGGTTRGKIEYTPRRSIKYHIIVSLCWVWEEMDISGCALRDTSPMSCKDKGSFAAKHLCFMCWFFFCGGRDHEGEARLLKYCLMRVCRF